ncbi:MAG: hypothetical protein GY852_00265 [bacterium]|nr:hypothetical protein [bacterium]
MGGKSKAKKPKQKPKAPAQDNAPKETEFTKVVDIIDPWKDEAVETPEKKKQDRDTLAELRDPWEEKKSKTVDMPKRKELGENTELGKAEVLPKKNYAERLRALRKRMENRKPSKYASREQPLWARPRGKKTDATPSYQDRDSRGLTRRQAKVVSAERKKQAEIERKERRERKKKQN